LETKSLFICLSLLFASLISAVDPVGTLAVLGKKEVNADPMLYSLIFGESVLNDAVSIVLYKTLDGFSQKDVVLTFESHFWEIIGVFIGVFIGSLLVGIAMGLLCSFILKQADLHEEIYVEFSVILLFSYGSYSVAEIMAMSGIVSVFSCGIVISHYAVYNVTKVCHMSIYNVIKSIAHMSENFLYCYLGITAGISFKSDSTYEWSPSLILFTLILCFISRAAHIFPFSALANCKRSVPIPINMQVMMWFAGIRGAIAFALSVNVTKHHRLYIVTTTLTVVFFTTIICGGFTERLLDRLGLKASSDDNEENDRKLLVDEQPAESVILREYSWLHKTWRNFDISYMKKWFGGQRSTRPGGLVFGNEFIRNEPELDGVGDLPTETELTDFQLY